MKTDGTSKVLLKDNITLFNIAEDWIFYQDASDNCLYRMKNDGTQISRLSKDTAMFIDIAYDWIYYKIQAFVL